LFHIVVDREYTTAEDCAAFLPVRSAEALGARPAGDAASARPGKKTDTGRRNAA